MTPGKSGRVQLPDGTVAFYGARWKMLLVVIGSFSFVAVCVSVLSTSSSLSTLKTVGLWVAALFFLLCTAAGCVRLAVAAPALVITQSEVFATSMFGNARPGIPLDQIDHVVVLKFCHNVYMAVVPVPESVSGLPPVLRRAVTSNQLALGIPAAICIAQVVLGTPAPEVAAELALLADCPLIDMVSKRTTPADADAN